MHFSLQSGIIRHVNKNTARYIYKQSVYFNGINFIQTKKLVGNDIFQF